MEINAPDLVGTMWHQLRFYSHNYGSKKKIGSTSLSDGRKKREKTAIDSSTYIKIDVALRKCEVIVKVKSDNLLK